MRREGHDHLPAGGQGEFLVELGHVAVMADAIGVEAFGDFGEQHLLLRPPARAGHARLGVDDDLVRIDGLGLEQRNERELGAGRVAAGIGDEPRRLDRAADRFRSGRTRLLLQFGREMLVAVPARVSGRIGQAEIGRQVDDLGRGARAIKSLMTFCVVPCGSAQKARSSPSACQSASSTEVSVGSA